MAVLVKRILNFFTEELTSRKGKKRKSAVSEKKKAKKKKKALDLDDASQEDSEYEITTPTQKPKRSTKVLLTNLL